VHAASADHLDVVGHFGGGEQDGRASDWLPSHSGFDTAAFARLWSDVASFLLAEALPAVRVPHEADAGQVRTEQDLPKGE
jgi:hypothetical protein